MMTYSKILWQIWDTMLFAQLIAERQCPGGIASCCLDEWPVAPSTGLRVETSHCIMAVRTKYPLKSGCTGWQGING
eukprot:scaffold568723_cov18-Prasinocladus_malaysianus.AAC.2